MNLLIELLGLIKEDTHQLDAFHTVKAILDGKYDDLIIDDHGHSDDQSGTQVQQTLVGREDGYTLFYIAIYHTKKKERSFLYTLHDKPHELDKPKDDEAPPGQELANVDASVVVNDRTGKISFWDHDSHEVWLDSNHLHNSTNDDELWAWLEEYGIESNKIKKPGAIKAYLEVLKNS